MHMNSIHICLHVVDNVLKNKRIRRLHGGKPPITGSGQYNFLLCLSLCHRQVPTLTELNGKTKHSLTSATEISLDTV